MRDPRIGRAWQASLPGKGGGVLAVLDDHGLLVRPGVCRRPLKTIRACLLAIVLPAAPLVAGLVKEGGNDYYRVALDGGGQVAGFYTAFTGPAHEITSYLNRAGELLGLRRSCITCGGGQDLTYSVVRSWGSGTDYMLGSNFNFFPPREPEAGFTCRDANDVAPIAVEEVLEGGRAVGVRASWELRNGPDELRVEEVLRVHGEDFVGSRVEMTVAVRNLSGDPARIGVRDVWHPRISAPVTPSNPAGLGTSLDFFVGLRPPDPPAEPFVGEEHEWFDPDFRMWQLHGYSAYPSTQPFRYSIGGAVTGPATLDPPPTPPEMVQAAAMNFGGVEELGFTGAADRCFDWRIPDPPRKVPFEIDRMGMVTYWGRTDATAIVLGPGEEFRATQYLVAFFDYPLGSDPGGPYSRECEGPVTRVPISGSAVLLKPTSAEVHHRWSSQAPEVTFADPLLPATEAVVQGIGAYPVELTVSVGAYEAAEGTTVEVTDTRPPRISRLEASPAVLWPPNHRMVEVRVEAAVEDDCDPAPRLRLVSVESSESDDAVGLGDGHTMGDIQAAGVGQDDRSLLLRAERDGRGAGRVYTLTYEATDWAGNRSVRRVEVKVPHDEGAAR